MVESQPSKLLVAGSIPVSRSSLSLLRHQAVVSSSAGEVCHASLRAARRARYRYGLSRTESPTATDVGTTWPKLTTERPEEREADVAQLAERVLGKDEVTSSILVIGSTLRSRMRREGCPLQIRARSGERRWADSNEERQATDVKPREAVSVS